MEKVDIKLECLRIAERIYSTENPLQYGSALQQIPLINFKAPKNSIKNMAVDLYEWVTEEI